MIPRTVERKNALSDVIRDPAELFALLALPRDQLASAKQAAAIFPLRLPRRLLPLMEPGNPNDPLLRQFLPLAAELDEVEGFSHDPLNEADARVGAGILHKYQGRALMTVTAACAVNCRYCFRRHFPYHDNASQQDEYVTALDYLAQHSDISEVVLSGGDPLMLSNEKLHHLLQRLGALPHIKRLRLHSRIPLAAPERIDDELLGILSRVSVPTVMVVHANHPHELDAEACDALHRLRRHGLTLLNQSVLLAGVNDEATILGRLSERLFDNGVLPYYLHLLDPVAGTAHFDVPSSVAKTLINQLRATLPGYLVPRLVREIAGEPCKLPMDNWK